jgi:hypothetical protein
MYRSFDQRNHLPNEISSGDLLKKVITPILYARVGQLESIIQAGEQDFFEQVHTN